MDELLVLKRFFLRIDTRQNTSNDLDNLTVIRNDVNIEIKKKEKSFQRCRLRSHTLSIGAFEALIDSLVKIDINRKNFGGAISCAK